MNEESIKKNCQKYYDKKRKQGDDNINPGGDCDRSRVTNKGHNKNGQASGNPDETRCKK